MSALQWHMANHSSCTRTDTISSKPALSVSAALKTPTAAGTVQGRKKQLVAPSVMKVNPQAQLAAAAVHSCKVRAPPQATSMRSPTAVPTALHLSCSVKSAMAVHPITARYTFLVNALSPTNLSTQHSCEIVPAGEDSKSVATRAVTDFCEIVPAEDGDAAISTVLQDNVGQMGSSSEQKLSTQVQRLLLLLVSMHSTLMYCVLPWLICIGSFHCERVADVQKIQEAPLAGVNALSI